MPQNDPNQRDIAERLLGEISVPSDGALPVEAVDAVRDARDAVRDVLSTADQAAHDLADLHERRNLVPAAGLNELKTRAIEDANTRASEASRRVERSLAAARDTLEEAALPAVESGREQLARQELMLGLGEATGDALVARALGIAKSGSREATAVMFTDFMRTFFIARGVANVDQVRGQLRTVAVATVPERGRTAKEIAAYGALQRLGKVEAAHTSSQLALRRAAK